MTAIYLLRYLHLGIDRASYRFYLFIYFGGGDLLRQSIVQIT